MVLRDVEAKDIFKARRKLILSGPLKVHRFKEMLMRARGNDFGGERNHYMTRLPRDNRWSIFKRS